MGCIAFNKQIYQRKLDEFEHKTLTADELYEAKQLLKVLDDLADEGYTYLNSCLENDFSCLTRLRALIAAAGEEPFPITHEKLPDTTYRDEEEELVSLTERLAVSAAAQPGMSDHPFLSEIRAYCDFIGCEEDTAYIFLFRDALLPYLYYKSRGRAHLYAWPISRCFLTDMTDDPDADDEIRNVLYDAMENGYTAFEPFSEYCGRGIRSVLEKYPKLKETLTELLASVPEKKIVVVESGYCGTIPMLLGALDDHVTFRMFTTAPYFFDTYRDHIYCRRYEDIRSFETLYSQDVLMQYSSCRGGRFYMRLSDSADVMRRALGEIKRMTE